jgi:hypothetical protein
MSYFELDRAQPLARPYVSLKQPLPYDDRRRGVGRRPCGRTLSLIFLAGVRTLLRLGSKSICKLLARFFRRWHPAINYHSARKGDGCLGIDVLAVDCVAMGKAPPGGILDAPCPPGGGPFDLRPRLALDAQNVQCSLPARLEPGFDDAVAAPVGCCRHHRFVSCFSIPDKNRHFKVSKCHKHRRLWDKSLVFEVSKKAFWTP